MVSCPEESALFLNRHSNLPHQVYDINECGAVIWNIWVPWSTKDAMFKKAKVSAKFIMQIRAMGIKNTPILQILLSKC